MIQGYIKKIQNQTDNDWGRYTVETIAGETYLCVGVIPSATLNMEVVLEGALERNKYGLQFKISSVISTAEDKFAGIRTFLRGGYIKGISEKSANEMIALYGNNCIDLLETPEGRKELEKIKGLGKITIEKAYQSYIGKTEEDGVKKYKDIVLFINGTGTRCQIEKIYNKYKEKTLKTLKKNPYILEMELNGFGFKKTDAIALATGIKKDSTERIQAGVKAVLEEAESNSGHCYLPIDEIEDRVLPLLAPMPKFKDLSEKVVEKAIEDWIPNKERIIVEYAPSTETLNEISQVVETRELIRTSLYKAITQAIQDKYLYNDDGKIYTEKMYNIESDVAKKLANMCKKETMSVRFIKPETIEKVIKEVEARKTADREKKGELGNFEITQEQHDAVYLGLMHRLCIISGGPGRGKTAISEIIAKAFVESGQNKSKSDVLMLAPTGKAARRITESTGYQSMTIHRATMQKEIPSGKLILCDESSMIDIYLLQKLLAFAANCNLIFVGDIYQIASVGPGKVLTDMIESGCIPYILLKEGHRNTGSIAKNSTLINSGMVLSNHILDSHYCYHPFRSEYEKTATGALVKDKKGEPVVSKKASEFMKDAIIADYIENVKKYGIQNVMLCTPLKERGDCCTSKLNKELQNAFTAGKPAATFKFANSERVFREGDRVMQIRNNYEFAKKDPSGKIINGIFNGETGTILHISYDNENETYRLTVLFDDGCLGGYTKKTVNDLQLAYAITLHKCQGSEAKCVMIAYTYADYMLLDRALLYTGVTRAKEVCHIYSEEKFQYGAMRSVLDVAIKTVTGAKRYTTLSDKIQSLCA